MVEALRDYLGLGDEIADSLACEYLAQLVEFPADTLCSSEPQRLARESHSVISSIQALSKKSYKLIVDSAANHVSLRRNLPDFARLGSELSSDVPRLAFAADSFSTKLNKAGANETITRRKQSLRLLHNAERLINVMELPPLLNSAIKSSPVNYSSILDLYAHTRRLASLYPSSPLVTSVLYDVETSIHQIATDLVVALKSPALKLAAGLRTVGWLKRVVSDLVTDVSPDDTLPAVFLVCRLTTLMTTLAALEPLRELADDERLRRASSSGAWLGGQQTERYLKRYIEIFREHAFGIVSMSKSVDLGSTTPANATTHDLSPPSSPLSMFPLYIIGLLLDTLRKYFPSITDRPSRDSIITQVLYCAGSLGRLGADFGVSLAALGVDEQADQMKRHRLLAGRLDTMIKDKGKSPSSEAVARGSSLVV
ncbi:hypothetical protein XA68_11063 [Ophiocordyceps unilateralis]|uniref:Conserved oligomeric Golgi complex subunit 8 n=1 Tax=Ophiocordyceps unilateralis TaxID=268505 RepID=A0A2A9P2B1_OPHUN|nr:hypothetical protein XA68_11063 [Ophiocordyceps unilateralis]